MSLSRFCIDLVYRSATGSSGLRWTVTPLAGGLFLCFIALFVPAALWLDRLLVLPGFMAYPWNQILGIPLSVSGLFLMFWSAFHFFRVRGTPVPFNPPPRLVCEGPYAHVRNPMLGGVFFIMFGLGFLFHSISLIFIITPAWILSHYLELKKIEEPELVKRLGEDYLEYRKRVPMFIPRIRGEKRKP